MFDFKSPTESKLKQTILEAEKWKWSMSILEKEPILVTSELLLKLYENTLKSENDFCITW